jgi:hypothetical protein
MVHHEPFFGRQAAQFLFLKIIPQNSPVPQQLFTHTLVLTTPTLQKRRVTNVPNILRAFAVAVAVATMPPNNSILPSVLPLKRLDDLLEFFPLFPFLPIIMVRVQGVSGLFRGGGSSGGLELGVFGGRGNRGSASLL